MGTIPALLLHYQLSCRKRHNKSNTWHLRYRKYSERWRRLRELYNKRLLQSITSQVYPHPTFNLYNIEKKLMSYSELLALRAKTTSQIAAINTFKTGGTKVENLDATDIMRLFRSLPELNKVETSLLSLFLCLLINYNI